MKTLLFAFLLLPIFHFSQLDANGWYLVNTGVDGTKNYIKNLEKKGSDSFECWVKMLTPTKKNKKGVTIAGGYSLEFWTVYCDGNRYSISDAAFYNSKGTPIDSFDRSYEGTKKAIPDSVAEGIVLFACEVGHLMED